MRNRSSTRKNADPNLTAKSIVDAATGDETTPEPIDPIKAAARALGRLGGLKGGKARDEALSDRRKRQIAKAAAKARWGRK